MACIKVAQGTPTWLPFIAANSGTGDPRFGILFTEIDVAFKKYTDPVMSLKTLLGPPTDFRENGNGVYEILFSALELNTLGSFFYVVNGNAFLPSPTIRQFIGQVWIESSSSYTPGTIALDTNVITGNLVDLAGQPLIGEAVSAKVLSAPTILGVGVNIGGVGMDIISTVTDASGFFALEILQESVVDIVIPVINYRRTLTVPAVNSSKLFDIP